MLNEQKLIQAQTDFLERHPGGFADPQMLAVAKKHRMDKLVEFATAAFSREACENVEDTAENAIRLVSRSSMVSRFEKPRFRDFVRRMSADERSFLVHALCQFLHGEQQQGFEALVDLLATEKLAKWSLVTVIPACYAPQQEVFVKPTTAKGVISFFEVPDLVYRPRPSWEFYQAYRSLIIDAKGKLDASLSPTNAAFTGFLMMSMPKA